MSEKEKQLPAQQESPGSGMPLLPMSTGVTKSSEKIEMQRATADVYAMHQRAMQQGRDEKKCLETLLSLCENVEFAAALLYKVPRGDEKVEGIGIDGANEIARIWGHIESGSVVHGGFDNEEAQLESFATDLVAPRRRLSRFSIKTTITYENKDPKTGQISYNTVKKKNIEDLAKGTAAKEERNCILDVIPAWVQSAVTKEAKRTLLATVSDIPGAFNGYVKLFEKLGVTETMLWQYIDRKPGDEKQGRFAKVSAAEIVDIRLLLASAKEDIAHLDKFFPNRDKKKKEQEAPPAATEPPKAASNAAQKETKQTKDAKPQDSAPPASGAPSAPSEKQTTTEEEPPKQPGPDARGATTQSSQETESASGAQESSGTDGTTDGEARPKRKVDLW